MRENIIKSISLVFILSMVAKIIAFVKSMIQASFFGASAVTDAYYMASEFVSNMLYMFTTSIVVAYIPLYVQKKKENQNIYVISTKIITIILSGVIILVILAEINAPLIMKIVAPNCPPIIFKETVIYFRILITGLVFAIPASLYQNILNAEKIYGYANFSSIINSVTLIITIFLFAKQIGIWSLVISVPISFFFQFLLLYARGKCFGGISLKFGIKDETIRTLAVMVLPILISQATVEINQIIDRILLSSVEDGAVTSISYSVVLYQFALHIINIPISTVIFTELSEAGARQDKETMSTLLSDTYKLIFLICIPIVIVVSCTSENIVDIVYGRGKFDGRAVEQTAIGLLGYIYCLIPTVLKSVLTKAYYGLNDTKTPMFLSFLEVVLNIVLSIWLLKYFGILGVVGATAISSMIFIIVMIMIFEKFYFPILSWKNIKYYWKVIIAAFFSCILMYHMRGLFLANAYINFAIKTLVVYISYFGVLVLTKEESTVTFIRWIDKKRKIRKRIS